MLKTHKIFFMAASCFLISGMSSFWGAQNASAANRPDSPSNSLETVLFKTLKAASSTEIDPEACETLAEDTENSGMKIKIQPGSFDAPGVIIILTLDGVEMIEGAPPINGELKILIGLGLKDIADLLFQHRVAITLNTGEEGLTGIMPAPIGLENIELILDLDKEDRAAPTLSLVWDRMVAVTAGERYEDPGATATADYMGIIIKPDSNGIVSIGGTTIPFSEDILHMFFAPTDISDAIVATIVDANGDDITDSVAADGAYTFPVQGNYKILYNVTDENGKPAGEIERQVNAESSATSDDGLEKPAAGQDGGAGDGSSGCFIQMLSN